MRPKEASMSSEEDGRGAIETSRDSGEKKDKILSLPQEEVIKEELGPF